MPNENNGQFSISNIQVKSQEISNFKFQTLTICKIRYTIKSLEIASAKNKKQYKSSKIFIKKCGDP